MFMLSDHFPATNKVIVVMTYGFLFSVIKGTKNKTIVHIIIPQRNSYFPSCSSSSS